MKFFRRRSGGEQRAGAQAGATAEAEQPTPVTDLHQLAPQARACIESLLNELIGEVDLTFDFYREWNGTWRARVDIGGPVSGQLDFVLLHTPGGGLLALPRPLAERWRTTTGIRASDGSRWTVSDAGALIPFVAP